MACVFQRLGHNINGLLIMKWQGLDEREIGKSVFRTHDLGIERDIDIAKFLFGGL